MRDTFASSFISHLRQSSGISCPVVGCGDAFPAIDDLIRDHLESKHRKYIEGKDLCSLVRDVKRGRRVLDTMVPDKSWREPLSSTDDTVFSSFQRCKSPLSSLARQSRAQSASPPRRSRARPQGASSVDPESLRRTPQTAKLWDAELDIPPSHPPRQTRMNPPEEEDDSLRRIKEPGTHPISQKQLVAATEDEDPRDREIWAQVSRYWYAHAKKETPKVGRLYHHLSILAKPNPLHLLHYYWTALCVPIQPEEFHFSRSNAIFELNQKLDETSKTKDSPKTEADIPLHRRSTSYGPLSVLANLNQFPLGPPTDCVSKTLMTRQMRQSKWILQYYIWYLFPSLAYTAIASAATSRSNATLDPGQQNRSSGVSDDGTLVWLWYPAVVAAILLGEFAAVHTLGEPLLLHGVSMGISAGAYLLMVFNQHEIPFHVQFSTWGMCAIITIAWTHYDTLNLRPEMRRLAVLAIIVVGFILDSAISGSVFASTGNSVFGTSDSPSTVFIFTTFLLPCMTMSAFLCSGIRTIYRQIVQHWVGTNTIRVQIG
ncbi:hypothetical protein F4678DRAFT_462037 [Xylaria arbuscula]|nr:hypothetical protein F4678DRAFT_462037 [Xylaria arbuscula]